MTTRKAGQHARQRTRSLAIRALAAIVGLVATGAVVGLAAGFSSSTFLVAEILVLGAVLTIDRVVIPFIDRWDRGATGEEHVGRVLEGLHEDGWRVIHDVSLGRGNIDHVLVGPAGLLTVETKSHGGRLKVARLDTKMLSQAYAQAKLIERIADRPVAPLLVFSRAYLDKPVSRQRGVVVLPARMLKGHLARRRATLSADEVTTLHGRLAAALSP